MVDVGRVRARWDACGVVLRDLPLALAVLVVAYLPAVQSQGTRLGDVADRPSDALAVVAVALQALPLAARRRWPAACLALVGAGFALDQLRGYHSVAGVAVPVALFSVGAHLVRRRWVTAAAASAAYVVLAVALTRRGGSEGVSGFVTFYLLTAFAWGVGAWLRQTRATEAERRRRVAEASRAAERTRLASELHDVVTHHVTAMVVQAEAARYLTGDPERLEQSLGAVTDTGRRAIEDLRNLLDVLDPARVGTAAGDGADGVHADRTPAVGAVDDLVVQARRAGQPVEYVLEGPVPSTPGSAEAAAYRVVQEALTNALKHALGGRTLVRVRHGDRALDVSVTTTAGTAGTSAAAPGSGRGLVGLRERVELLGGELGAGPQPDGTFVVHARIPVGPVR